jgi:hypothetical protein
MTGFISMAWSPGGARSTSPGAFDRTDPNDSVSVTGPGVYPPTHSNSMRSRRDRCISAGHLIREAERWNALGAGEAERIVTATLADFATALDHVAVPQGVPAATAAQLAWNVERLQSGAEIGERPRGYRRRRS